MQTTVVMVNFTFRLIKNVEYSEAFLIFFILISFNLNFIFFSITKLAHRYLEYNHEKDTGEDTGEDLSINEERNGIQLNETIRKSSNRKAALNNRLISIKKQTTSNKRGRKNSIVTESIQMSSSMPNLDNSMFTHGYATRHTTKNRLKNNSILAN